MMQEAAFILMRLFRLIACVMAYQRSTVIMVNVNTDKWFANTVKKPATRQPAPAIFFIHSVENGLDCNLIQRKVVWILFTWHLSFQVTAQSRRLLI